MPTRFGFHQLFFKNEVDWFSKFVKVKANLMRSDDNEAPSRVTDSTFTQLIPTLSLPS
jgi:hypothetical protein